MATKATDFYSRWHTNAIALFLLVQLCLIVLGGIVAWILWQYTSLDSAAIFLGSIGGFLILQVVTVPFLVNWAGQPLLKLTQAVLHVSKESLQTPPPDVAGRRYEQSGLKALVQTVYELAVNGPKPNVDTAAMVAGSNPYRSLFNNAPCGIVALNNAGEVVLINPLAPVHQDSTEQYVLDLQFPQRDTLEAWLADCQANKVHDTKTWQRIANADPGTESRKIFDVIGYYTKNGEEGIETILIMIDRTTEYAPEEDNMDFIALAAHELRGPVTVIRGYLDLLDDELKPKLPADQQQLIERLQVSSERLSGYINNILNVSRYDRHHLTLHLHEENLFDIIKSLVPDLALRAKTQNRRLTFHVPVDLPNIAADRNSLSEVLNNLIDNAIKYSKPGGEVIVTAEHRGDMVEVTVQDFGIGMPESVVGNLFNKFYRSHRSRQQVSGTGLGLYICKAIIESHGGSIWVRSREGQGTTFGFTIPDFTSVADRLAKGDNSNQQIIQRAEGWIKNHAMYRR